MNVLILTPDRVGSTLLQRLITIYMQFNDFDRPVINLHELTNGLIKYYSPTFNQEVLGKSNEKKSWGYYQTLEEVQELLASVEHYKTSRLALYHIVARQDTIKQQVPFYQYLNDNFFIISARRQNLFEHALSWCIFVETRQLNVYTHQQKFEHFADVYRTGLTVDQNNLWKYLDSYVDYLNWTKNHFHVHSYFDYDTHMQDLEAYILDLPIFRNQTQKLTWRDTFDIGFAEWNRCHYLCSDISALGNRLTHERQLLLPGTSAQDLPLSTPALTVRDAVNSLTPGDQVFLRDNAVAYKKSQQHLNELVDHKILVTGVPIKLQTMLEKRLLIRNFSEVVDWYNQWVDVHGVGQHYTDQDIVDQARDEIRRFHDLPLLEDQT